MLPDTHTANPIAPIHFQWYIEAVIVTTFIPNEMMTARNATNVPLLLLSLISATYETFEAYDNAVELKKKFLKYKRFSFCNLHSSELPIEIPDNIRPISNNSKVEEKNIVNHASPLVAKPKNRVVLRPKRSTMHAETKAPSPRNKVLKEPIQ